MNVTHYAADRIVRDPPVPLGRLLAQEDGVVWVDMTGPTDEDLKTLRDVFHFHPLAIEDTLHQRQRPKLEEYEGYYFMTLHAMHATGERKAAAALDEVDLFFGDRYLVTVHPHPLAALEEARTRLEHAPSTLRMQPDYVVYIVVDTVVDTYFPVLDRLDDFIERLEDQLFKRPTPRTLDQLFAIKRSLLHMRRVAAPLRDIFTVLTRHDLPFVREQTRVYFRDVYDHLLRITDMIDTHRDLLTGALDIYLSVVSNRLNEVMKVLTVITALAAPLAVISGIYGMNFTRSLPPFELRYGFPLILVVMLASVVVMLTIFRRLRWL